MTLDDRVLRAISVSRDVVVKLVERVKALLLDGRGWNGR
jgi:hypothetical protein